MPPRLSPEARSLIRGQRGLIADWQAPDVGLSRRRLRWACANDEWQQVGPRVFSDRVGSLSPEQMRVAGLLEAGPSAALAGRAALAELGWRAGWGGLVDVTVPRGTRLRGRGLPPWIGLHYWTEEPRWVGDPRCCAPARAAIDAASWARSAREALFVITSVVQQRVAAPQALDREFVARVRLRNAPAIRDALGEVGIGATSSNEAVFLRACRRRGLPAPRMQTPRIDARGSRRRTDAEFRLPDGRLLIVEIDGVGHFEMAQWQADLERGNALVVGTGALVLHVTGWELRNDPDPFFVLLTSLF